MRKDMRQKTKKPEFMPNAAYGDLKYAVRVYRDWYYNNAWHTDHEGVLISENFEFIVSEGNKRCIKRFKTKTEAKKWLDKNRYRFWPGRDAKVVRLRTPKQIRDFEKAMLDDACRCGRAGFCID